MPVLKAPPLKVFEGYSLQYHREHPYLQVKEKRVNHSDSSSVRLGTGSAAPGVEIPSMALRMKHRKQRERSRKRTNVSSYRWNEIHLLYRFIPFHKSSTQFLGDTPDGHLKGELHMPRPWFESIGPTLRVSNGREYHSS